MYNNIGYSRMPECNLDVNELKEINHVIDCFQGISIDHRYPRLKVNNDVFDENGTGKLKQIQHLDKYGDIFNNLLQRLLTIVQKTVFNNSNGILRALNMQLFEKHPNISKETRPHQDNAYFKLSPPLACTLWIALDDMDSDRSCLNYSPGSHIGATRLHSRFNKQTTFRVRSGVPGLSLHLKEHNTSDDKHISVRAGDALLHNCNTIHWAAANKTQLRRRAIGIPIIPNICKPDLLLMKHFRKMLRKDIELQRYKNPVEYKRLVELYNN
jgi:phytanoyl-CoA hydroxylase